MRHFARRLISSTTIFISAFIFFGVTLAHAQQSQSSNYQLNEVFFGSGGSLESCSGSYCSKQSAGELTVGNTASTNFQAQTGFNTNREEFIEVGVTNGNVDMGVLATDDTKAGTAEFYVKSYLAHGYVVQSYGNPPTNAGHSFAAPTAPATSTLGVEQFGINLVSNTLSNATPGTFGSLPVQDPDNTFSFGSVAAGYNTANQFQYEPGEVIAQSASSSGFTRFTISYIMNISPVTPGGTYSMNHVIVATSSF